MTVDPQYNYAQVDVYIGVKAETGPAYVLDRKQRHTYYKEMSDWRIALHDILRIDSLICWLFHQKVHTPTEALRRYNIYI